MTEHLPTIAAGAALVLFFYALRNSSRARSADNDTRERDDS